MDAKYFVVVKPQTNDHHSIHKEGCPFLPDKDRSIYLGKFSSGMEAVKESHIHFKKTKCCIFCSKEIEIVSNENLPFDITSSDMVSKELRVPGSFHQSHLCCVN
jgi:hypothetical protein